MSDIVWAKRQEPHGTPYTGGYYCHGCKYLSCIPQRKMTEPWRYFCEASHTHLGLVGVMEMDAESCPHGDDDGKWSR